MASSSVRTIAEFILCNYNLLQCLMDVNSHKIHLGVTKSHHIFKRKKRKNENFCKSIKRTVDYGLSFVHPAFSRLSYSFQSAAMSASGNGVEIMFRYFYMSLCNVSFETYNFLIKKNKSPCSLLESIL